MSLKNVKIARISHVPFFVLTQLRTQIEYLCNKGALVTIITSDGEGIAEFSDKLGTVTRIVEIKRAINIYKDLVALIKLYILFKKGNYDIVHSTTPKAGLLVAIAGYFAKVPIRLHTFTGQRWVNMPNPAKYILKKCDQIIGLLNTRCYTDSKSQRDYIIQKGIISPNKIFVIGNGSVAGVDLKRFDSSRWSMEEKCKLRKELGILDDSFVITYTGRITRDKGIRELIWSVKKLIQDGYNIKLLLVGPNEFCNNDIEIEIHSSILKDHVGMIEYTLEPEKYLAISDLLCLPSYREGFGTGVIEAAVMGLPTVGTDIYGLCDAVVKDITGILVQKKNKEALHDAIKTMIKNSELRKYMGENARIRAIQEFDSGIINEALANDYSCLLKVIGK